jgi:hypothetical protein
MVRFSARTRNFYLLKRAHNSSEAGCSNPEPWPTQPSLRWVSGVLSAGCSRRNVSLPTHLYSLPMLRKPKTLLPYPTPVHGEKITLKYLVCICLFIDKFPCFLVNKSRHILDSIYFFSLLARYFPFCPSVPSKHSTMQHTNEMFTNATLLAYNSYYPRRFL